jgi:hypothetical protein
MSIEKLLIKFQSIFIGEKGGDDIKNDGLNLRITEASYRVLKFINLNLHVCVQGLKFNNFLS